MKKAIQLLLVSLLVLSFVSCSSDSDTNSPVLLKKLTGITMGKNTTHNFSYNGTKLTKVAFEIEAQTDGNGYDQYFYTNNLISEIRRFNQANQNTTITYFTYDSNNRMIEALTIQPTDNYGLRRVFSYNLNGTVTVTQYGGDLTTQNNLSDIVEIYHFQNGEVSQKDFVSNAFSSTVTYSYDNANHPLKNVTGISEIKLYSFIANGLFGMEFNVTQRVAVTEGETVQANMEVDYNADNYPIASYSDLGDQYQFVYIK